MISFSFGYIENLGATEKPKFDCIRFNQELTNFALCDGANSTPWGGHAAELTASALTSKLVIPQTNPEETLLESFSRANDLVLEKINNGATTALNVLLSYGGIYCASCGDSLIEAYKLQPLKGWVNSQASQLDLLEDGHSPSQLIGSPAFHSANIFQLPAKGSCIVLMMSDGLHAYTTSKERLSIISKIKKGQPSNEDMQFICSELGELAIKNQSKDDVSAIGMWINFN
ncbi:PP2C family serine/threonine-protein phosphatase [Polynucleobacter sp. IMCC 30228]|uniref:PP2C family serine/threonine-protein phosphatase n=1 Tax=Polynucleobacter sp. IMCC 30228 TaxID=2781011 RepID=UPI001F166F18|nr:PP2C family serine/threonine-protein phosphatase [Polynucleobacter sp. IMCC 30228]MCE7526937.1 protein phosphatase 2C family protein [Polynucleobacter sp. IMCC 30228]